MAQSGGKISYTEVLVHVDSTFSRLFDMKTLLPLLVAKRVVPRNFQDRFPESRRASVLLGVLKRKPSNFFEFLRVLLQHASQGDKKSRRLVCIMSTHVKNLSTYEEECPGSGSVVLSFLAASEAYKSTQESSSPTLSQKQVVEEPICADVVANPSPVLLQAFRPLPGYMDDPAAHCFSRDGGTLYSPIHGIEVVIPPNAPPLDINKFWLSIHVYPRGPFVLPEGVVSCSPAVWFFLRPTFEFAKDVIVRIPHSARGSASSDVCVYRMPTGKEGTRDPPFVLSEKVEGCECDWYHTTVHVRHFSPHKNAASKETSSKAIHKMQPHSMKHSSAQLKQQRSSSFEKNSCTLDELTVSVKQLSSQSSMDSSSACINQDSSATCTPPEVIGVSSRNTGTIATVLAQCVANVNQYSMTRGLPRDLSTTPCQAKFYIVQSHPSHSWEIVQDVCKRDNVDVAPPTEFSITGQSLQFSCRGVSEGWSIEPAGGEEITVADLNALHAPSSLVDCNDAIKTGGYPACITYQIDTDHTTACPPQCTVDVTGANKQLQYKVKEAAGPVPKLTTPLYLYEKGSPLVEQLSSGTLRLDLAVDDHLRLITDVSLQLSDPEKLARMLCIDDTQFSRIAHDYKTCAEQIFRLVHAWVCKKRPTITELCTALGANSIMLITSNSACQKYEELSKECKELLREELALPTLAGCLRACWPFVGRFLGLPEEDITEIAQLQQDTKEQAFEMIRMWRMMKGREATFCRVHTAIQRLWEHDSMRSSCHNAYHCFTRCLEYYHYLHKQAAQ